MTFLKTLNSSNEVLYSFNLNVLWWMLSQFQEGLPYELLNSHNLFKMFVTRKNSWKSFCWNSWWFLDVSFKGILLSFHWKMFRESCLNHFKKNLREFSLGIPEIFSDFFYRSTEFLGGIFETIPGEIYTRINARNTFKQFSTNFQEFFQHCFLDSSATFFRFFPENFFENLPALKKSKLLLS